MSPTAASAGKVGRLKGLARVLLAPAFGLAIALSFTLGWIACNRAFSPRAETAAAYFALAGLISAGVALIAARLLRRRPWSARIAAVLICLLAGTAGLASVFMMLNVVLAFHDLSEVPIPIVLIILAISTTGEFYNVLAIAGPLILPLGLPLIALFAALIARNTR